jgi:predicted DNA-binding transcriptional regulator YafY
MPANRNALIRYKTIDNCLRNRYRQWTLEDLVDACSDALYEYEGIEKGVSTRTVQMDIQVMRSEKLGYNAPIVVVDKKFYTYEDPEYSITNIPLNEDDLGKLSEVVQLLKQFKGFSHFEDVGSMINRLEDKIYTSKTKSQSVIDFEKNDDLIGLQHLNTIYQAIIKRAVLEIHYQSFKARQAGKIILNPYLLKEFRNRWFLLGRRKNENCLLTLALDRIKEIRELPDYTFQENTEFDFNTYFDDIIGVTKMGYRPQLIKLLLDKENAPYVLTKPLHSSQKLVEKRENGVVISIYVIPNFELEKEILSFGEKMIVLSPKRLRLKLAERMEKALKLSSGEVEDNEPDIND